MSKCSYIFFPESDQAPLLANNLDTTPEEPFGPPQWPALNKHPIIGSVSSGILLDETRKNPTLETMRRFIQFRDPEKGNVYSNGERYAPECPQSEYIVRTII